MNGNFTGQRVSADPAWDIPGSSPKCPQCHTSQVRRSYTLWHERLRGKGRFCYCHDCTLHFYWREGNAHRADRVRFCGCGTDMDMRPPKSSWDRGLRFLGLRLYTCRRCGGTRHRP